MPADNRLLFEAGASFSAQILDRQPQADSTLPTIVEQTSNLGYRAISTSATESLVYLHQDVRNYNIRGSMSYVTGSHAVRVGMTYIYARELMEGKHNNGNVSYLVTNGRPTRVTYWNLPYSNTFRLNPKLALFAQDQWTVRRLTVNAGLRYDYLASDYPDLHQPASQFFPVERTFPGQTVVRWHDVSPRVGVSHDLFGHGRTALKASLSRYVQQLASAPARPVSPVTTNLTNSRAWTDVNGDFVVQGDPMNHAINDELGPSGNINFGQPGTTTRYADEFAFGYGVRPANWEMSAGVQHELVPRVSVGASYFRRAYVNLEVTDNLLVGPSDYDSYCVTAPVDSRLPGAGQPNCGLYDLKQTKVGQLDQVRTSATNYGDQIERWNGFDFTVNARLQNNLLLQGGVSTGKTLNDNCDIVDDLPESAGAGRGNGPRFCRTETPFLTQVKLLGAYTLPWQLQIAGTLQSVPGPEIVANAVFNNAQISPSLGRNLSSATTATINLVKPGTMYGERLYQLDVRFGKIFTIGGTRLHGMVDLYNALNADTVLTQNNTYGTNGASWQVPTFIVQARIVKFGVQMTF